MPILSALIDDYVAQQGIKPAWTAKDLGQSIHISGIHEQEQAEALASYLRSRDLLATVARLDKTSWGIVARPAWGRRGCSPYGADNSTFDKSV